MIPLAPKKLENKYNGSKHVILICNQTSQETKSRKNYERFANEGNKAACVPSLQDLGDVNTHLWERYQLHERLVKCSRDWHVE